MRLMQRLAISGLLSVILIVLLTGTFVTRRDLANVVERGVAPEERNEQQLNPAWVQNNAIPGQDEARTEDKDRRVDFKHRQSEPSAVEPPPAPVPGPYVIKPPNPPLDDVTNQRREKIKEVSGCFVSGLPVYSPHALHPGVITCACSGALSWLERGLPSGTFLLELCMRLAAGTERAWLRWVDLKDDFGGCLLSGAPF